MQSQQGPYFLNPPSDFLFFLQRCIGRGEPCVRPQRGPIFFEELKRAIWIGTINGLDRLKKEADGKLCFEPALNSVIIICLFEDYQGSLWAGTYDSGLYRLKDAKFRSYYPLKENPGDKLFSMYEVRNGDTWIGTVSGKLYRFRSQKCIEAVEIPGLSGTGISAIAEDAEGNLWLGTIQG